jgi:hypothetical protein
VHSVVQVRRQKKRYQEQRFDRAGGKEGNFEISFAAIDSGEHFGTYFIKIGIR